MQYVSSTKKRDWTESIRCPFFFKFPHAFTCKRFRFGRLFICRGCPLAFWLKCSGIFIQSFQGKKLSTFTFITLSSCSWKGRGKSKVLSWLFRLSSFLKKALEQFNQRLWYPWRRWLWRLELGVRICRSGLINYHGNRGVRLNEKWFLRYPHIHIQQLCCMIMA